MAFIHCAKAVLVPLVAAQAATIRLRVGHERYEFLIALAVAAGASDGYVAAFVVRIEHAIVESGVDTALSVVLARVAVG